MKARILILGLGLLLICLYGRAAKQQGYSDPPRKFGSEGDVVATGVLIGTVANFGIDWLEVRSDGSNKIVKMIPKWRGGQAEKGGGPEKRVLRTIRKLKLGDRVEVNWFVDNRVRIKRLKKVSKRISTKGKKLQMKI